MLPLGSRCNQLVRSLVCSRDWAVTETILLRNLTVGLIKLHLRKKVRLSVALQIPFEESGSCFAQRSKVSFFSETMPDF